MKHEVFWLLYEFRELSIMDMMNDKPDDAGTDTMECRQCGSCCRMHQAFVKPGEIQRIITYLGITTDDWEQYYDDSRWEFADYRLIRHVNGACVFLDYSNGLAYCAIHEVKPDCCSSWQPGPHRKECLEGMK